MKAYLALTTNELRLAFRDKQVLFFNYAFPLIFFFLLSAMLHADRGGSVITVIVTNVLVIGILGNGFFGAGIRAVQEREQNILRRFKVAPISPLPILGASLTTGLLLWTGYGALKSDWVIVAANSVGAALSASVLIFKIRDLRAGK